jgi:hypothetical protein
MTSNSSKKKGTPKSRLLKICLQAAKKTKARDKKIKSKVGIENMINSTYVKLSK